MLKTVQILAVVGSTGLSGAVLLGLGIAMSEYRPSGASLVQQGVVALAVAILSMALSVYLLIKPLGVLERLRLAYVWLFAALGSALTLFARDSFFWDWLALGLALLAVLSTITAVMVVVNSNRSRAA